MRLRFEIVVMAAVILLNACSQRAGVIPQSQAGQASQRHFISGYPALQHNDLMYVADETAGKVVMYTYPQGGIVTTLTQMAHPRGECVDSAQNVYITNSDDSYNGSIYVFAHGAYNPTTTLAFPYAYPPDACSVDPITGDVAAANSTDSVAIYNPAKNKWTLYIDIYFGLDMVAYDSAGNLFLGGRGGDNLFHLAVITADGTCFCTVTLNKAISDYGDTDYTLQWDGAYLALTDTSNTKRIHVYRISVSGTYGTVVDTVTLRKNRGDTFGTGYSWIHGNDILAGDENGTVVASWRYPKGGKPKKNITLPGYQLVGIAVSNGQ